MSRRAATEFDIFEHPYVKRLEDEVEKWQGKWLARGSASDARH